MRCNGSNWAVYSPGSWEGFRNDVWALWAGVIMRLEHHLVGGYVRYISPHIILLLVSPLLPQTYTTPPTSQRWSYSASLRKRSQCTSYEQTPRPTTHMSTVTGCGRRMEGSGARMNNHASCSPLSWWRKHWNISVSNLYLLWFISLQDGVGA